MSYKEILGDYKKITIKMKDVNKILKYDNINFYDYVDNKIKDVFGIIKENPLTSDLICLEITENGIKFNIDNLKARFCFDFDLISDDDITKTLEHIKREKQSLRRWISKYHYDMDYRELRDIIDQEDKILRFKELCSDEDKFFVDDEIFDYYKLSMFITYDIMYQSLKDSINDTKYEYIKARKYIEDYIINNSDKFINYSRNDQIKVKEMISFLQGPKEDTVYKEKKDINKYDYSFFESDGLTRENYTRMCNYGFRCDNSEKLKELLKRKMSYYDSLNYTDLLIGKDAYSGYIGFRLDNGMVILDKFFNNVSKGTIAYDNAIYIINNEDDFEMITKMSKPEARRAIKLNLIDADWKPHSGDFEGKINGCINKVNNRKLIKKK